MSVDPVSSVVQTLHRANAQFPSRGYHYPSANAFLSYGELFSRSTSVAKRLLADGLRRGEPVGVLLKAGPQFITSFFGVERARGVPVPLALTPGVALSLERLLPVIRDASMRYMIVEVDQLALSEEARRNGLKLLSAEQLAAPSGDSGSADLAEPGPEDLAFIQYTSGSTAAPKGVAITHANAIAGMRSIAVTGKFTTDDVFCSWLPHFHDLGLIGCLLLSTYLGCDAHVWPPSAFIKKPGEWLRYFGKVNATIYTGPNFSYATMCDEIGPDEMSDLDLSSVRLAFNGAEPIDAQLMEAFADKFMSVGLRRETLYPVYGLAEVVLAATFPEVGEPVHVDWIDRAALGNHGRVERVERSSPGSRGIVAVGRPVDGIELRITGDAGDVLGNDQVGIIELRGPAVMRGYYGKPELTAEVLKEGWLRTGDYGYLKDNRLYVVGRSKDLIKQAGQSYYPEDIEAVVGGIAGVHRGGCVAVVGGPIGDERIVCLAEAATNERGNLENLAQDIGKAVRRNVGIASFDVILVKKRSIARTTSGKLQRHAMKQRVRAGMDPTFLYHIRF
jgi:fatty-acyl-CoA synthase